MKFIEEAITNSKMNNSVLHENLLESLMIKELRSLASRVGIRNPHHAHL